jgi:hypothetical protein
MWLHGRETVLPVNGIVVFGNLLVAKRTLAESSVRWLRLCSGRGVTPRAMNCELVSLQILLGRENLAAPALHLG